MDLEPFSSDIIAKLRQILLIKQLQLLDLHHSKLIALRQPHPSNVRKSAESFGSVYSFRLVVCHKTLLTSVFSFLSIVNISLGVPYVLQLCM